MRFGNERLMFVTLNNIFRVSTYSVGTFLVLCKCNSFEGFFFKSGNEESVSCLRGINSFWEKNERSWSWLSFSFSQDFLCTLHRGKKRSMIWNNSWRRWDETRFVVIFAVENQR